MISYTKGNAITLAMKGNYVAFAHGCNCFCRMGRGIAKEVKDRLPEMYLADQCSVAGSRLKLGTFTSADYKWGRGYNLYTQYTWNDKDDMVDWPSVDEVIQSMFTDMKTRGLHTLVLPKICAGLARGHLTEEEAWSRVTAILKKRCPDDIEVLVVEYDPDA